MFRLTVTQETNGKPIHKWDLLRAGLSLVGSLLLGNGVGQGWSLIPSKTSDPVGSLCGSCDMILFLFCFVSFHCFTFKTHARHEASLESTWGAVFPPQFVDGAVVAAGTQVVLFTWRHNKSLKSHSNQFNSPLPTTTTTTPAPPPTHVYSGQHVFNDKKLLPCTVSGHHVLPTPESGWEIKSLDG